MTGPTPASTATPTEPAATDITGTAAAPPLHVVPDSPGHGVVRIARQLAEAVGAPCVDVSVAMALPPTPVHVHVTDRLFGATAEEAAEQLVALARRHPTTVTLHDVPQPGDGPVMARRAATYAALLAEVRGWVVASHHEVALVRRHVAPDARGTVVPLPVLPLRLPEPAPAGPVSTRDGEACAQAADTRRPVVGVLGWVYPGKGHAEIVRACAGLGVTVRAIGRASPGHASLIDELEDLASEVGVDFEASGWIPDGALGAELQAADVPVAAHRHVSASGSINSWIAAGRRPLVAAGSYAEEMDRLRPGTLTLVADDDLPAAIRAALATAATTRLGPSVGTAPHLADCASLYRAFWRTTASGPRR